MDRKPKAAFEDQKDLVARRACVQRCTDLAARASFIEGCARAVQGEEDQFHFLARKNAAGPRVPTRNSNSAPLGSHSLSLSKDEPMDSPRHLLGS
jgi:hypothetical protein